MDQPRLWIFVVVAMMMPLSCLATYYTVGDNSHWELDVNYTTWASGKNFAVGDHLVFKYPVGRHDALVVSKTAYDSCTTANPLVALSSGNDTITLTNTGATYYICGFSTHCSLGMKLTITVGAASSTPPPASSTGSPPSSPPTEAPASPPGSTATPPPASSTGSPPSSPPTEGPASPPGSAATPPPASSTGSPLSSPPSEGPASPPGSTATPPGSTATPPGSTATPPGSTASPPGSTATPPGSTATPPGTTSAPPPSAAATSYPMDGVVFVGASIVLAVVWL